MIRSKSNAPADTPPVLMTYSIPRPLFHDESMQSTAELQAELWRDCQTWALRVLNFVTKNRPDTRLSAHQVAAILIFAPERFGGRTVEEISARVQIPVEEIEAAVGRVRLELFGRSVRRPARIVRPGAG